MIVAGGLRLRWWQRANRAEHDARDEHRLASPRARAPYAKTSGSGHDAPPYLIML